MATPKNKIDIDKMLDVMRAFASRGKATQEEINQTLLAEHIRLNVPPMIPKGGFTVSGAPLRETYLQPSSGMMQVAEDALVAERTRVENELKLREAQVRFMRDPSGTSFIELHDRWALVRPNERRPLFDFIVNVLRPGGLPRDGPFVWSTTEADPTDTEDLEGKNITMATKVILTPPGVSSFLNLQKARAIVEGAEPRFSLTLIFDKAAQARPEFKAMQMGVDEALRERWPSKLPHGLISPFHAGEEKAGVYEGYKAGDIFISPWTKNKPGAVNAHKEDIIDWSEFYAGWICRANVRPFAYDTAGKRGASFFLESVQFLKPGKRLDGRKAASESFPDDAETDEEMV